jgi:SRSO17 transposase
MMMRAAGWCGSCAGDPGRWYALIDARQWIPAEHISDPVKSLLTGLPLDLRFRTKGQLAIDICTEARADGVRFDFLCGDEVYGNCTELREFCEKHGQGYVLRVSSTFRLTLAPGSRCPAPRRSPACSATLPAGRSAPPGPGRRGSAGMRGRGWAPPPRGITC